MKSRADYLAWLDTLIDILSFKQVNFSVSTIKDKILTGEYIINNGLLIGKFTLTDKAELENLGLEVKQVVLNGELKIVAMGLLPQEFIVAGYTFANAQINATQQANEFLNTSPNIDSALLADVVDNINKSKVDDGIKADLRKQKIAIPFNELMTKQIKQNLVNSYAYRLDKPFTDFHSELTQKIRQKVVDVASGNITQNDLLDFLAQQKDATKAKTEFWVRQETNLIVSQTKQEYYKANGVEYYEWSASHDGRVRDSHAHLDGTLQRYDKPPLVDARYGRHANPGQDFNCRCVAIPISPNDPRLPKPKEPKIETVTTISRETNKAYLLNRDGVEFWVQKKWYKDGALTPAGEKAYQEKKAETERLNNARKDYAEKEKQGFIQGIHVIGDVQRETEKAILLRLDELGDKKIEMWLPKSSILINREKGNYVLKDSMMKNIEEAHDLVRGNNLDVKHGIDDWINYSLEKYSVEWHKP